MSLYSPNMPTVDTRVMVFSSIPQQNWLEFRLIFADGYEKYYKLTSYEVAAFRASERDIIEHLAQEYYDMNGYGPVNIRLIFL